MAHRFQDSIADNSCQALWDIQTSHKLKFLKRYLKVPSFKMETLFSLTTALHPRQWTVEVDFKDAYHPIMVHPNIRKYFWCVIDSKSYQFQALPLASQQLQEGFPKLWFENKLHAYLNNWITKLVPNGSIKKSAIPTFGIRVWPELSCIGGKNACGYGCYWRVQCRPTYTM